MTALTVRLPEEKHRRLKALAKSRGTPLNRLIDEMTTLMLAEFDAVVWVQGEPGQAPPCTDCRVLAQRWHIKSRHRSGEVTLDNLWRPQEWLFREEWLLAERSKP